MKMPLKYRILIIVVILVGLFASFMVLYPVYALIKAASFALDSQSPAPDTIIGQVEQIQRALKATGIPRYDPCEIDDDPGPHFRRAYLNKKYDQYNREICSRMAGERK